jgi:hypothetical protein
MVLEALKKRELRVIIQQAGIPFLGVVPRFRNGFLMIKADQKKQRLVGGSRERGYVLATLAVLIAVLMATVGFAVDFGTAYIVQNEAQAYCDSAALAAALELDSTGEGINRARQRALAVPNRWLFSGTAFGSVIVEFSSDADGPWEASPASPSGYGFARVRTGAAAPMNFLPLVTKQDTAQIQAEAVAGQIIKTTFTNGVFPYSPFAHDPTDATGNFGLQRGNSYTLRWPANMNKHAKPCPADANTPHVIDMKLEAGDSIQGYIDSGSAAWIREAIVTSEQHDNRVYTVGEPLYMSTGNKQTEDSAMQDRVSQDLDTSSTSYDQYVATGNNNGRRLVIVPINTGPANGYRIAGFGLFFLGTVKDYQVSPSDSFCAEYVGPAVLGATNQGANPGGGAFSVRLVR